MFIIKVFVFLTQGILWCDFFVFGSVEFGNMASCHLFFTVHRVNWHISGVGVLPEIMIYRMCSKYLFYRTRWRGCCLACFQNMSAYAGFSARSGGVFTCCTILNVRPGGTTRRLILIFRFWIIRFSLFVFCWLPELLLGYCVDRYQAADSISVGYAVWFSWE